MPGGASLMGPGDATEESDEEATDASTDEDEEEEDAGAAALEASLQWRRTRSAVAMRAQGSRRRWS